MPGVAKLIIDVEGRGQTTRVFDDISDDLDEMVDAVEDAQAATGDLTEKLYEVGEAGGNAESGFRGIADISGFMADQLGLPLGPLQENAAALADLGGGVESLLKGFPALFTQISAVIPLLGAKATAWWAVAAATIAANAPLILIIGAIALLAAGIVLLVMHWDTITEKIPILGQALEAVKAVAEGVANWITGTLVDALMDPQRALQDVLDFARDHWPEIAVFISGPFAPIVLLATDAFGVRSAMLGALDELLAFARDHWPEIASLLSGPFFPLVALATDAFGIRTALSGAFGQMIADAYDAGTKIPGGLVAALDSLKDWVWQKAYDFGRTIYEGVKSGLGKLWPFSPSEAGVEVGEGLILGIEQGFFNMRPVLGFASEQLGAEIMDKLQTGIQARFPFLNSRMTQLITEMRENSGQSLIAWINSLGDDVRMKLFDVLAAIPWEKYGLQLYEDASIGLAPAMRKAGEAAGAAFNAGLAGSLTNVFSGNVGGSMNPAFAQTPPPGPNFPPPPGHEWQWDPATGSYRAVPIDLGAVYNATSTGANYGKMLAPGALDLLSNTGQHGMPGQGGLVYDSVKQLYVKPEDLTKLQSGGEVLRGGWAMVGERGPELAYLPTGSSVYSNQETRRGTGHMAGSIVFTGPITIVNNGGRQDVDSTIEGMGFAMQNAARRRGMWAATA